MGNNTGTPLTLGEKQAIATIKNCTDKFLNGIKILVQLEAMKAKNDEDKQNGDPITYKREDFLSLWKNDL